MPTAEIDQGRIYIWSEISDRERIKEVPGSAWDVDRKQWHVPLSWGSCQALRGIFQQDLVLGEQLKQWGHEHVAWFVKPALALRPALEVPELMTAEPDLYPFQRVGVKFLSTVRRGLLADDMGSGKTIQIIRALVHLERKKVLIVCPNSMKFTWKEEIATWAPAYSVSVIDGTAAKRRKAIEAEADIYIINWESLRLHSRLAPYGSLALSDKEKELKELNEIPLTPL